MLRSMFAGVSGLRNHQIRMDVIGNNIANVNTYGFKSSRVTFQEMYAQTMQAASGPSGALGGINPKQIGLGMATASVDVLQDVGGNQTTDRPLDLCLEGDGFFRVMQEDKAFYTRTGNFYVDPNGYLVTSSGMYVQGLQFLDVSSIEDENGRISEAIKEVWGEDARIKPIDAEEVLGADDGPYQIAPFDPESPDDFVLGRIVIPPGYHSIAIGQDGLIKAIDHEGVLVNIGMITVTNFITPDGLNRVGSNLYQESANSGAPSESLAGFGEAGTMKSGSLEMSNVDLSKEFTDMIITQRGFQANSRIITVSDTLLEELVNLKR